MIPLSAPICAGVLVATIGQTARAQSPRGTTIPATPDNFVRAETDVYFKLFVSRGSVGKFVHLRALARKDPFTFADSTD